MENILSEQIPTASPEDLQYEVENMKKKIPQGEGKWQQLYISIQIMSTRSGNFIGKCKIILIISYLYFKNVMQDKIVYVELKFITYKHKIQKAKNESIILRLLY